MPRDEPTQLRTQLHSQVEGLFARPTNHGISLALVIQQGGEIIAEHYGTQPANEFQPELQVTAESTLTSWSMVKSMTHAAVGIMVRDGLLDIESPAPVLEWAGTTKSAITVLDLLEMRSGLRFVEDYVDDSISNCIEMLFGDSGPSHAAYAAALPFDHPPGTVWSYASGTTNIVVVPDSELVLVHLGKTPAEASPIVLAQLKRMIQLC